MRLPVFLGALGVLLALLCLPPAGPASAASLRAAEHDGFARMVFEWSEPTGLEIVNANGLLRLRFSRPLEDEPARLLGALPGYVTDATLSPDGRTLNLMLARPVRVWRFQMGATWVVDLFATPESESGEPATAVTVRTGEHGSFFRFVFDWPEPVQYTVASAGRHATIRFEHAAGIDAAALRRSLPADIRLAEVEEGTGLRLLLEIPPEARLRYFRAGPKVVVDVLRRPENLPERPAAEAPQRQARNVVAPPPPGKPDRPAAAASTPPAEPATEAPTDKSVATQPAPGEAEVPQPPLDKLPAEARHPAAPFDPLTKARLRPPERTERHVPTFAVGAGAGEGKVVDAAEPEAAAIVASPPPPRNRLVTLSFSWEKPVAAAVFRRAGWLWIVFNGDQEVDLRALEELGEGKVIRFAERLPHEGLTVLRMITEPGVNPTVRRDGLEWLIDLAVQPHRPTTPVEVLPRMDGPSPPHLFLPVPEGGPELRLVDPEVGDELVVVPVIPVGHGIFSTHDYPEMRLLASAQGIVIRPRSDTLDVTSTQQGLDIARSGGLAVSPDVALAAAGARLPKGPPVSEILDLRRWDRLADGDFVSARKALQAAVIEAPPHLRNSARLDLARFLVANGFAAEALGVLERAAALAPEAVTRPEFRAVRAVANVLMERYQQALEDLEATESYRGGELAFWKAIARAGMGRPETQLAPLVQGAAFLVDYPPAIRLDLAWVVAEAAVRGGDGSAARMVLDLIAAEELDRNQALWLRYLQGAYARLAGNLDEAVSIWREVERGTSRKARAYAARDRIELQLSLGEMTPAQAASALDSLRFAWRDEAFEYDLLYRVGRMQIDTGSYSDGLRTLKSLVSNYPDNPRNDDVAKLMRETFVSLFLGERSDDLAPLTAIALFNEFRELTPPGPQGDDMIRRLADRLVSVDLLGPAAELLRHQVEFRLSGQERARVATRLALVELLHHQPREALAALDQSRVESMPADLVRQRRHLRARALHELGRTDEALALLDGDDTYEARLLRAEFLWDKEDWPLAARAFAALVEPPQAGQALDDMQARLVLHWASALTLAANETAVQQLRRRFAAAMQNTPYGDAFDLITAPSEDRPLDIASIDDKIRLVESFQAFLAGYRQRLAAEGLSAMN